MFKRGNPGCVLIQSHTCACNMCFVSSFTINWQFRRIDLIGSQKPYLFFSRSNCAYNTHIRKNENFLAYFMRILNSRVVYSRGLQTTARGPNAAREVISSGPRSHFVNDEKNKIEKNCTCFHEKFFDLLVYNISETITLGLRKKSGPRHIFY